MGYGEIAPPASISYSVAPSCSAPACAPTRVARTRNGSSGISGSHSGWRTFGSLDMPRRLPPDALRGARDRRELGPLVADGQRVADDGRGEATLGADPEALEVDPLRRLAHARLELVLRLGPRPLRRHEAEDDLLVVGDEGERVEAAGALVVVLEQQAVGMHAPEDRLGGRGVAAGDQPSRVLVPAAQMEAERDAGDRVDDRVVELDPVGQPALERPPALLVE